MVAGVALTLLLIATAAYLALHYRLSREIRITLEAVRKAEVSDASQSLPSVGDPRLDEIVKTTRSMGERSLNLIRLVAEKVAIEKEVHTAELLQAWFFPKDDLDAKNFKAAGKFIPTSECGGDWWQYARIGDEIVIAVGDVMGHGVPAALITAAVHSAFNVMMRSLESEKRASHLLKEIVRELDRSVREASGNEGAMTALVTTIDTRTGILRMLNASHCPPYIYNARRAGGSFANTVPVGGVMGDPLGILRSVDAEPTATQLMPGDVLLWYTDGLFEPRRSDGQKLRKRSLFNLLGSLTQGKDVSPRFLAESLLKECTQFYSQESLPDDVTVVIGMVSADATFSAPLPLSSKKSAA